MRPGSRRKLEARDRSRRSRHSTEANHAATTCQSRRRPWRSDGGSGSLENLGGGSHADPGRERDVRPSSVSGRRVGRERTGHRGRGRARPGGSAEASTLSYRDYLGRLALFEQALRASGQWALPHPWLTTFVGDGQVASVVGAELEQLVPADLGPLGQISLSAFHHRAITTPLARLPADDLCYVFNFIRVPTTRDEAELRRLVLANRSAYDRIRSAGGTLYPVSAFPMSRADWRRHFGNAFDQLVAAKREFDPGRVLTPGYEVF